MAFVCVCVCVRLFAGIFIHSDEAKTEEPCPILNASSFCSCVKVVSLLSSTHLVNRVLTGQSFGVYVQCAFGVYVQCEFLVVMLPCASLNSFGCWNDLQWLLFGCSYNDWLWENVTGFISVTWTQSVITGFVLMNRQHSKYIWRTGIVCLDFMRLTPLFVYLSSLVDSTSEKCEREGVYVGQGTGSLFLPLCTGTVAAEPLQLGMATSRVVSWPSKCQLICEWNVAVRSDCISALWPWTVSALSSSIYCVQMRWVTQGFESTLYEKILWDFGNSQDLAWSWILKCLVLFPILGFGVNRENGVKNVCNMFGACWVGWNLVLGGLEPHGEGGGGGGRMLKSKCFWS